MRARVCGGRGIHLGAAVGFLVPAKEYHLLQILNHKKLGAAFLYFGLPNLHLFRGREL